MADLKTGLSGYQLFFSALPLRFYCLLTLVFVLLSAYLRRDYGPMLKAERRAQTTGQVIRPGAAPMTGRARDEIVPATGVRPVWWAAVMPRVARHCGRDRGMAFDTWNHADVMVARRDQGPMSRAFLERVFFQREYLAGALCRGDARLRIRHRHCITRKHGETGRRVISSPMRSRPGRAGSQACGMR